MSTRDTDDEAPKRVVWTRLGRVELTAEEVHACQAAPTLREAAHALHEYAVKKALRSMN